jgi:hypothetical protein
MNTRPSAHRSSFVGFETANKVAGLMDAMEGAGAHILEPSTPGAAHIVSLGYRFLVSVALGVSVGVLGSIPTAAALIAHVQLLIFLMGLVGVVALLLRIDTNLRE